jgi:adenylate cyclase
MMDLARFNELLLDSTGVALAAVDPESGAILFHNRRFLEWFPAVATEKALVKLVPTLDFEKMSKRVAAGRPFSHEAEVTSTRRPMRIVLRFEAAEQDGRSVLLLECQNITKMKELEYMIESYSKMVERQNREIRKEKDRVERLLLNIMPKTIYDEWKAFGVTTPQRYEASVLMLDFVDFTEMSISHDPPALIGEINDIFTAFDRIVEEFSCERLKTIGDAYIAVCGLPEPTPDHAQNIAKTALRMVRYLRRRNASHPLQWRCRIGINTGAMIGSIVGIQKYVYDIFGPGVNLAARLEALAGPMEVVLAEDMRKLLRENFLFEDRGVAELKGFGEKRVYCLKADSESGLDAPFV